MSKKTLFIASFFFLGAGTLSHAVELTKFVSGGCGIGVNRGPYDGCEVPYDNNRGPGPKRNFVPRQETEVTNSAVKFGVDLGGAATKEAMQAQWVVAKANHGALLGGLHPIAAVREIKPGVLELRLVVGPFSDITSAAKICAALTLEHSYCRTATFDEAATKIADDKAGAHRHLAVPNYDTDTSAKVGPKVLADSIATDKAAAQLATDTAEAEVFALRAAAYKAAANKAAAKALADKAEAESLAAKAVADKAAAAKAAAKIAADKAEAEKYAAGAAADKAAAEKAAAKTISDKAESGSLAAKAAADKAAAAKSAAKTAADQAEAESFAAKATADMAKVAGQTAADKKESEYLAAKATADKVAAAKIAAKITADKAEAERYVADAAADKAAADKAASKMAADKAETERLATKTAADKAAADKAVAKVAADKAEAEKYATIAAVEKNATTNAPAEKSDNRTAKVADELAATAERTMPFKVPAKLATDMAKAKRYATTASGGAKPEIIALAAADSPVARRLGGKTAAPSAITEQPDEKMTAAGQPYAEKADAATTSKASVVTAACPGNPDALGTSRVLAVNSADFARIGNMQYERTLPLADHEVVLTFDDGPLPAYTNRVLDALAAECVKATFFMIGSMAKAHPDTVRRGYNEGHTIGTHSQHHPYTFASMSAENAAREINDGVASIGAALGDARAVAPFFRFPGLLRVKSVEDYLASRSIMTWSADVDADDWFKRIDSNEVLQRALSRLNAKGRGIVLLHDIQPATAIMLPTLLKTLKSRGYRIVHVVPTGAERLKTLPVISTPLANQTWPRVKHSMQ